MSLKSELEKRVQQLENRVMMIPRYTGQQWLGKNPYKLEDIPKLKEQIEETKAAIKGINEWRERKRQLNKKQ
jgi:hypothetical protein